MACLKSLSIHGLKRFKDFNMKFNDKFNIIVGENESGKSTILDAIDIVLMHKYKNFDKYIIKDILNKDLIREFESNPRIDTLPYITIELELELENIPKMAMFYGTNHKLEERGEKFGICFKCSVPQENIPELLPSINSGKIPYDYYQMSWNTFQGSGYNNIQKPLNFVLINNDNIDSNNSYNYYNRTIFNSNHNENERLKIKSDFREKINDVFEKLEINELPNNKRLGINERKVIFENIITIFDDDIPIENKGSGRENIIKTQIALDKTASKVDVIAIEEPENHLSHNNLLKMIESIRGQNEKQLIITTHNSMIANSLNLSNVIWIRNEEACALREIAKEDADFFLKSTSNNMLHFILSDKVILVEGPTEFMMIPYIYNKIYGETIEKSGIVVIDCGGVTYKRYIDIARKTNKKVAVLTDNDENDNNINFMTNFNSKEEQINIFMDSSKENWTWEACLYNLNSKLFEERIKVKEDAEYLFHKRNYGKVLGKMLNNKVDVAYDMINDNLEFEVPQYIKDALEWIRE